MLHNLYEWACGKRYEVCARFHETDQRGGGPGIQACFGGICMNTLRVLLIEDDPTEAGRISAVLERAHHDVLPTIGFDEASEALLAQKFDAVVVGSPVPVDGMAEFAAKLRELEESQRGGTRTPVLSFSPDVPGGSNWSAAQSACVDGFLPEPFEPEAFADVVNKLSNALRKSSAPDGKASSELPIFEPEEFKAQVAHDNDLLIELIDLFLTERIHQVAEMRQALAAGDYHRLHRVAHTIKGSLSSLHAPVALSDAQQLEQAAKGEEDQVCRFSLAALEQDLDTLEPHLLSLRESSSQR